MINESSSSPQKRMPVLFVGHGSPMNAIEENSWSAGFRSLAKLLPRPKSILAISAHWYVPGTFLTGIEEPETIHDFGGFPQELFEMQYPAPGNPDLAKRVVQLIGKERASLSDEWGLDHGTWSVLHHMYPAADIPVVQLSIDRNLPPQGHLELGEVLRPLRSEGVLVMGSGNITHNLRYTMTHAYNGDLSTPDWATTFDAEVATAIEQHDSEFLCHIIESKEGRLSHPSLDHYLPLLYSVGCADTSDRVQFPITGFDLGSLSMRAVLLG